MVDHADDIRALHDPDPGSTSDDPTRFNGTVVVEWMNVSAGESAPDWDYLDPALMRSGSAYVGVSAQALGVQRRNGHSRHVRASAGWSTAGAGPLRDPGHPGDQYALDMFAQIGQALGSAPSVRPGRSAPGPRRGHRRVTIGVLPDHLCRRHPASDHAYDGIFIHCRGGGAAPLDGQVDHLGVGPADLLIRTDLDVPVFMFETQTDLIQLGYASAQQPNTSRIRTWEVAGTSHADAYLVGPGARPRLHRPGQRRAPARSGPGRVRRLRMGGSTGEPRRPAEAVHLTTPIPRALALDTHGNVVGGVRTPAVDVPVSTLSGAPPSRHQPRSPRCSDRPRRSVPAPS